MHITDEMLFEHAADARNIWLNTLPRDDEIPEFRCSHRFERKMQKLLKEQRRTPKVNRLLRYMRQTVAAILAVAIISFCGLMTVEAYREKVIEIVVRVFNELTDYRFVSHSNKADEIILPELSFGYIPEGMCEIANRITSNNRRYIMYEDKRGAFFEMNQRPVGDDGDYGSIVDTEDATCEVITINGIEANLNSKDGNNSIIWVYDNIVYNLYGNIDLDELSMITEKIEYLSK